MVCVVRRGTALTDTSDDLAMQPSMSEPGEGAGGDLGRGNDLPANYHWDEITYPVLVNLFDWEMGRDENRARRILEERTPNLRSMKAAARRMEDAGLTRVFMTADGPDFGWELSPRGMRAIGQWPEDEVRAVMIRALEQAVEEAPDESSRSKATRALARRLSRSP